MFNFFNRGNDEEEEMNKIIDELVNDGYIVPIGKNEDGEVLYQTTPKFRKQYPDFYKKQIEDSNEIVFQLWKMGLIDMTVKEDINDWVVLPNKKTFSCDVSKLTKEQAEMILYIRKDF